MLLMNHIWLYIRQEDLAVEWEQLSDEGRDVSSLQKEYDLLRSSDLENSPEMQARARQLLDQAQSLPLREDYPFAEPSGLEEIRALRPSGPRRMTSYLPNEELLDRVHAAWLGRCSGNLLGKPVEGWLAGRIQGLLQDSQAYPLSGYFRSDISGDLLQKYSIGQADTFINNVSHAVEDDDLNYTVTGLAILDQHGPDFTPEDVANFWLWNIPVLRTCTAERIAYRNFSLLIPPPRSAVYRNPYREWIGAQIRADFWGYAALGDPERAAEYAWRDASISHIKNGVYGAMWVAAMLAAAPFVDGEREVIRVGLSEIPADCRLAADVLEVISWKDAGCSFDEAVSLVHKRWNEQNSHHWCHTLSNAQLVAVGLLWGETDFGRSICRAVQPGFDTDCNGATVGSIFGMMHGTKAIPEEWTSPLNDTLETGITGYRMVRISELARKGFDLFLKHRTS